MVRDTLRILIAEDDAGDRRHLVRTLRDAALPIECRETASIEEALRALDEETFDCAILDYYLPGEDGLSGISLLRERCPGMPILMVTGQGNVSLATEAMKRGAADFMPKLTITPESIRRAVENSLAKATLQRTVEEQREKLIRLEAECQAVELKKELEHAIAADLVNRHALQLRDEFLSQVSHELRAPLASISSFSSLIADGLAGPVTAEQGEYLAIIEKNVQRLGAMIEDLLLLRALQTGKLRVEPKRVLLGEAILDAMHTLEANAGAKGVALSSSVPEDLAEAFADPMRLSQVLIILCDNAIKFTPPGGSVTVLARASEHEENFLVVEVSDTGCGIDPEQVGRVFDHLYQVADVSRAGRKGLGLGLHIAQDLVIQQGGEIRVESTLGEGSRFSFTVPVYAGQEEVAVAA